MKTISKKEIEASKDKLTEEDEIAAMEAILLETWSEAE